MHFSVPYTQELIDEAGNTYLGYDVHINGIFHCTVRYKQLHNLHEQLVKDLDLPLPPFPPKKFFPLTINQQEERRLSLDKYIQTIGQNTNINNSEILNGFLLNAQLESAADLDENENIFVFLMNNSKINVKASVSENSGQILKKVCKQINLVDKYYSYFSLFLVLQDEENFVVLRKLQDFESPLVTQRNMNIGTKIVIGKWYWDTTFDLELLHDPVALDLLYMQTTAEIQRGWITTNEELRCRLSSLKEHDKKKEYLEISRSLKFYGYIQFAHCICDYPQSGSEVSISIGRNELNIRVLSFEGEHQEIGFKVTRMRCWRITTLHEGIEKYEENPECSLELSFEYLMAKDHLQWITISSVQAILMSVCLQSMIDELLLKNVGGNKNQDITGKTWTYITRDGHSKTFMGSPTQETFNKTLKEHDTHLKTDPLIKKITERFSAVKVKNSNTIRSSIPNQERRFNINGDSLENNAFCIIGDDDL